MFLILNNETAFNKQIIRIHPERLCPDASIDVSKTPQSRTEFSDINASGYAQHVYRNKDNSITIVINGNIKNLDQLGGQDPLLQLYKKYGFKYMLQLLEGDFSIILLDHNPKKENSHDTRGSGSSEAPDDKVSSHLYVAQDRLGLCPLYMFLEDNTTDRKIIAFANTAKQLQLESASSEIKYTITPFIPGTYSKYEYPFKVLSYWKPIIQNSQYFVSWPKNWLSTTRLGTSKRTEFIKTLDIVKNALCESILLDLDLCKRATLRQGGMREDEVRTNTKQLIQDLSELTSPDIPGTPPSPNTTCRKLENMKKADFWIKPASNFGPIGCLLSGGLDSSITVSLIRDLLRKQNCDPNICHTFAMGFEGSSDLVCAKEVAKYIGGSDQHTEMIIDEKSYIEAIPIVIKILETADIATIRYGVALYLMLLNIYNNTSIRDIFTGDGADEAMGGFLNFYYTKNMIEYDNECHRLLEAYHKTGALYQKLFHYFGMRWYRPFLNNVWLSKYMSLPMEFRYEVESVQKYPRNFFDFDKDLLRYAFSEEYFKTTTFHNILPNTILWRTSEPGYDGIFCYNRPINKIILPWLCHSRIPTDASGGMREDEVRTHADFWQKSGAPESKEHLEASSNNQPNISTDPERLLAEEQSSGERLLAEEQSSGDKRRDVSGQSTGTSKRRDVSGQSTGTSKRRDADASNLRNPDASDIGPDSSCILTEEPPQYRGVEEMEYYKSIYSKYFPGLKSEGYTTTPPYKYAKTKYEPSMRNLDIYLEYNTQYQDRSI